MEGQGIRIDLDVSTLWIRDQHSSSAPEDECEDMSRSFHVIKYDRAYRLVAICNFAMDVRSSVLAAADTLVRGVLVELPFTEPFGVEVEVDASVPFAVLPFVACFAAFSARRFCFDAEGGMVVERDQETKCSPTQDAVYRSDVALPQISA